MDSHRVRRVTNEALSGIEGHKKLKGIKRYVVVDKNGILIAKMVSVGNIRDSEASQLLIRELKDLCLSVKTITADGVYRGEN
jgi:putative transposase